MGYIYLIRAASTNRYKIGFTDKDIKHRLRGLQTASPFDLELISQLDGTRQYEQKMHLRLRKFRCRGEWFEFQGDDDALWHFHDKRHRTPEEIRQTRILKGFMRANSLTESLACRVMAKVMLVTPKAAKRTHVHRDTPLYDFFSYMAFEQIETGRKPNLDEFAYAIQMGLDEYMEFRKTHTRPPLWDRPEVPDYKRKRLEFLEPLRA